MVMGAMRALCEFSLLVSRQNYSDLSRKALDDALERFYKKNGIFRELTMSKSAKAKVDDLLATESYQWREQKIYNILAAMDAHVYGAEEVSLMKRRDISGVPE